MTVIPLNKDSSLSWTPIMTLQEAISEYQDGTITGNKMIVIALDDDNDNYILRFRNAGMKGSEIVSVLEAMKSDILKSMGY